MEQVKNILLSRTFWLAVVQGLAGVIVVFNDMYPNAGWALILKSVIDIALRYTTEQPVRFNVK